jgi:soluble lytic murein transglycosylase
MNRSFAFLCVLLACVTFLFAPVAARAANIEIQNYKRAFALVDAGHADQAMTFAAHGRDPVLNKILRAYYMAQPGNDISFGEMATFVGRNPDWPGLRGIITIAEQKIPAGATPDQVIDWFNDHPPITLIGFYRYIDALNAAGRTQSAADAIRTRWIEGEFTQDELTAYAARFSRFLDVDTHWARLDRVLWKADAIAARRIYPFVGDDIKSVAEARLALVAQQPNAVNLADALPVEWQDDAGLLYERLRWDIHNNLEDQALALLQRAPDNTGNPARWWEQRQILLRRFMDRHDYASAYRLAVGHGNIDGKNRLQAEFLAGWLALRFLGEPDTALGHFQALYDNAQTPISRARGAYWLARTLEALGNNEAARQIYEDAAALNITYYGQLAAVHIYDDPVIIAKPEPSIPSQIRAVFYTHDLIRAVERLHAIGARDHVTLFFRAAIEGAQQRADFALLTELAYRIARPDLSVEAAKAANQKNILMAADGFPLLSFHLPAQPEPAFIYAVIRQESMFNPDAQSAAGARGLMQLMPATAKGVAHTLDVKYQDKRLSEKNYSLHLGSAFIQHQIDMFDGSYILALAGYNAGPHRVREWMEQIGDPRSPNVDPIDWIEEIPSAETRNYVQRILENLQIYRARLKGGQAPLLILKDLRRGS